MADSVYKIIELVGTNKTSWEKAAAAAIKKASASLRDLRIAEIGQLDMQLENGKPVAYRARVKVSFKFGDSSPAPAAKAAPAAAPAPAAAAAPKKAAKKKARKKSKKSKKKAAATAEQAPAPKKASKKKARRKGKKR